MLRNHAFWKKKDVDGNEINFDEVYCQLIIPAIEGADLSPIHADEETINGIIHKPMYEQLILCDYAVADLTTANANLFYELGVRHSVKPYKTITIFSSNSKLPFDLNFLRCMPYEYHPTNKLTNLKRNIEELTNQLIRAKKDETTDSPVYKLVDGIAFQNSVSHEKTDIFRDQVKYDSELKSLLARVRNSEIRKTEKIKEIDTIVDSLKLENLETGVLIDIMLSYRAVGSYDKMVDFIKKMPSCVQQTVMCQEQLGFALNRNKLHNEAIAVLEKIIDTKGANSKTCGILGRVYKDLFEKAYNDNNEMLAEAYLDSALEAYKMGFNADWRDAYPGVNLVTLLDLKGEKEEIEKLIHVVEFAVLRKIATKKPDYWDYATLMELALIENNEAKALENLKKSSVCPIEGKWIFETTLGNLNLINNYRIKRQEDNSLPDKIIQMLEAHLSKTFPET